MSEMRFLRASGAFVAVVMGGLLLTGCSTTGLKSSDNTRPIPDRSQPTEAQRVVLEKAEVAKEAGDYTTAMALFREILSENPTITTAYIGIGDIYIAQGDYAEAEPAYERAARLEPRNFEAQFGHGLALQMLNRFVEALRAYHRALIVNPGDAKANLNIAITYLQMGEPQSAKVFAERSIESDPANGPARVNLGAVYAELGMHAEAIDTYRTAMELVDPSPEIILNLINSLAASKRYRETIDAAATLNRMEPNPNAYERMGWAWFKLKDFEQSIEAYQHAVELDARHWPSWNGVGVNALNQWILSKKRDDDARRRAGDALRQSLRINANQPNVIQLVSTYRL